MKKMLDEAIELAQVSAGEDRPFPPPAVPVIICDLTFDTDRDGERWDGLS